MRRGEREQAPLGELRLQCPLRELIHVRMVLEEYIAAQACENAADEEIEELAALAQASRPAEDEVPKHEQRLDLHVEFRRKLTEMSHNGVAETLTGPLLEITRHFHLETEPTGSSETDEIRRELVQSLRKRKPEAAKHALPTHFAALQARLLVSFPDSA
ncbi:FCD domain-containing protein [Citricoccus nitrophenolicus]